MKVIATHSEYLISRLKTIKQMLYELYVNNVNIEVTPIS